MAAPLNTLHIDLAGDWRGGQYQCWLLMSGLVARGHGVALLTVRDSTLARRAHAARIPVHEVSRSLARLAAAQELRQLVRRVRYDVVHAHEAHAHTALWLARVRATARIVSRRVVFPLGRSWVSRQKYKRGVDCFIAVSEYVRGSFQRATEVAVRVVHDGVEVPAVPSSEERRQARARFGLPDEALVVSCLGPLEANKGQLAALEALPLVRKSVTAHLLVGGDGPLLPRLVARSQELGLIDVVHLKGYVEDMRSFFVASDVFLFPAVAEGLGTSLLLAMAHQLPVIALAGTAADEVIRDGESGRLVLSTHPEALAGAVVYLARHPEFARELAANARAAIVKQFTVDHMVEQTLRVYESVREQKRA